MKITSVFAAVGAFVPLASGFVTRQTLSTNVLDSSSDKFVAMPVSSTNTPSSPQQSTQLYSMTSVDDETPSFGFNAGYAALWAGLLSFAALGPGDFANPADTAMIEQIVTNPASPGINELYYTLFNVFATMPVIAAMLVVPQDRDQGLPAAPFLGLSVAFGYFSMGPYLILRSAPVERKTRAEMGWFSRDVLENKLFAWSTFGLTILAMVAAGAIDAYQQDPVTLWNGFVDLMTTSKFCAVSGMDLALIHVALTTLIPRDYALRNPDAPSDAGVKIAAATFFLPYIGSSLYLALRPSLEDK